MSRTHITLADLVDNHACKGQRDLFVATFGDKAKIGPRAAAKAIKAGLDVSWLWRLIPASALAEYEKVTASAWSEYNKVMAPAWAEYIKARASAWSEYEKALAPALVKALTARGEA